MPVDLGNYERESRAPIAGMALVAVCSVFAPSLAFHAIGLDSFLWWLSSCAATVRWPVTLVLWVSSFVLLLGLARGILRFIGILVPFLMGVAERICEATARALTAAVFGGGALAGNLLTLALYPARCACEALIERAQAQCGLYLQGWREEQELRRLYRDEFRAEFRSFREFKRQFRAAADEQAGAASGANEEVPRREETRKADPFAADLAAAFKLIGVPESGSFTAADLKKRYLKLIRKAHPDAGGSNELAARINAALSLIKKRKGWS